MEGHPRQRTPIPAKQESLVPRPERCKSIYLGSCNGSRSQSSTPLGPLGLFTRTMARRRNCRLRWKGIRQHSPFLRLPGEIRTMIYRAALISPKPIDLWPNRYVEKPENNPAIASRISKLRKEGKISHTDIPTFRQQVSTILLFAECG